MLRRIREPQESLLTLEEVKAHLRLDQEGDEKYLLHILQTATEWVEKNTGRALLTQQWQKEVPAFTELVFMDILPIQKVTAVVALMPKEERPIAAFRLIGEDLILPRLAYPVRITFDCGYGDEPNAVPVCLRQAVLMAVAHLYEGRTCEGLQEITALSLLISPYRVLGLS